MKIRENHRSSRRWYHQLLTTALPRMPMPIFSPRPSLFLISINSGSWSCYCLTSWKAKGKLESARLHETWLLSSPEEDSNMRDSASATILCVPHMCFKWNLRAEILMSHRPILPNCLGCDNSHDNAWLSASRMNSWCSIYFLYFQCQKAIPSILARR
jgi:hypothetical protein